jgi:hypothetical protein
VFLLLSLSTLRSSNDWLINSKKLISEHRFALFFILLASIFLVHSFSQIIMWAESDAIFHSSLVRMIKEGTGVPKRILPLYSDSESYVLAYPKGFHFFSAFFVQLFGFNLIAAIKIIPLVIQIMLPFGIYALLIDIQPHREVALFAFLMVFFQFNHLFPLFFGLYPSMTSLIFVIALLVFLISDRSSKRNHVLGLVLLMSFLFFVHQKYVIHGLIGGGWAVLWRYRKDKGGSILVKYLSFSLVTMGVILASLGRAGLPQYPDYLWIYMTKFVSVFIPEWYQIFLALPGLFLLVTRKNREDWFFLGWIGSWFILAFLADAHVFGLSLTSERRYQELYLPISVLAGIALFTVTSSSKNKKTMENLIVLTSILAFPVFLGSVITSYAPAWSLSTEDYNTMKELENKEGVVVNLDPTGRWIYPIAGLKVTNPRGEEVLLNTSQVEEIIESPVSEKSLKSLKSLEDRFGEVYVFSSQRSSSGVGYNLFGNVYPKVDVNRFKESDVYELFYEENGSVVFRYEG